MIEKKKREFPVTIYGKVEKYNDVLTKIRCRTFYKYGNRNGTYITDEFAEKLISTLSYVPIKGIYNEYTEDYEDHGIERSEGRIYGIVPKDNNFSWEFHLDEDGIEREYACTDVLLFTGLYEETYEIPKKPQSMELFAPSLKFHYEVIQGQKWCVFDDGCFLGLQVLGDDVEPCFEGAAFYTLQNSIEGVIKKIENFCKQYEEKEGGEDMSKLNFKLSDNQKFEALWSLLNTDYTEEGRWEITYSINDVFDDYALAFNYETQNYERIYYEKDDETDSLVISKKEPVFIMDITENEKATIETLRRLNGDTYDLVDETLEKAKENSEKISEYSTKINELEEEKVTLNQEKAELQSTYESLQEDNATLAQEVAELKEYKLKIEKEQKESIIEEYNEQLSEEVLNSYREKIDDYSVIDLDKELAYALKKTNSGVLNSKPIYVFKEGHKTGIEAILDKYI